MTAQISQEVSRLKTRNTIFNLTVFSFAAIVLVIILYPLWFIVIASFSDPSLVSTGKVWLYPLGFTMDGYNALFANEAIWIGYRNTILYVVVGTFIHLAVNIPAAYALSRKDMVCVKPLTIYFLITMFFSGGLIPTFLTVRQFGLYNTFLVMVLPFTVSVYVLIVARTFFETSIPSEMWEAAEIEGCGNLRFFFSIVLPLSKAILAVIGLWHAVWQWNSYFNALIYLRDASLYPLQLILRNILIVNTMQAALGTGEAAMIAMRTADLVRYGAIIVSTLPIMCVYPFLQKYFNQGALIGAVKG
jgi:putative aldouronate transport system permease protein